MLKSENISFSIGNKIILHPMSLTWSAGKFHVLLGPNGSGKSSLLKILAGDISHFSGNVFYDQIALNELKIEKLAKYRAVLSQKPIVQFPLSVEEVVLMGRYPHFDFQPSSSDYAIVNLAMDQLGLQELKNRDYNSLSGGEQQRVQFARVLAQIGQVKPGKIRYLLLDEPLNNLDLKFQRDFLEIAKSLLDPKTVLIAVLHDIILAIRYADEMVFLKEGRVKASGIKPSAVSPELIKDVFEVDTEVVGNKWFIVK